jgi:hypothetical protein
MPCPATAGPARDLDRHLHRLRTTHPHPIVNADLTKHYCYFDLKNPGSGRCSGAGDARRGVACCGVLGVIVRRARRW